MLSLLDAHDRAADFIEAPAYAAETSAGSMSGLPAIDAREADLVGRQLGHYRIERVLGRGGMGVVYLADDTRLGRTVALKAVAPKFTDDEGRRERLRREARAAASLSHPGIATVYALEEFGSQLFLVSEYVPGDTLRDELRRGPLPALRAMETALAIARALASAHDRGIVHRDLKPENIIRAPSGTIKILDFGLARVGDSAESLASLTEDGAIVGTPAYMSPEQARGQTVDFRSDLFSLGILLYEMASGIHPFAGGSTASTIVNILEADPAPLTGRSQQLAGASLDWIEPITQTCLHKRPGNRFPSTHALITALEQAHEATGAGRSAPEAKTNSAGRLDGTTRQDPRWWWQFHQAAVTIVYASLLIPAWIARTWVGGTIGPLLFLAALVAVITACTLRLHLWFTLRSYPSEWRPQRARSTLWIRLADIGLAAAFIASAGFLLHTHIDVAVLLVGMAVAVLLSATIIEPATTRAAFGDKD